MFEKSKIEQLIVILQLSLWYETKIDYKPKLYKQGAH